MALLPLPPLPTVPGRGERAVLEPALAVLGWREEASVLLLMLLLMLFAATTETGRAGVSRAVCGREEGPREEGP